MKRLSLFFVVLTVSLFFGLSSIYAKKEKVEIEPDIITATRTPVPVFESLGSISVINGYDFNVLNDYELFEVLRGRFGIDVVKEGGPGRQTSVFLRGANSGHTLVLFGGQRINSPMTGGYDFSDMLVDEVDHIEIVRGPMSTLYGSDAIGGIINIVPKKGSGPFKAVISAEAGSFSSFHEHVLVSEGFKNADYLISLSRTDSDGIGEDDDFESTNLSLNTGLIPTDKAEFRIFSMYTKSKVGIDDFDIITYSVINDPNSTQERETLFISGLWKFSVSEYWDATFNLNYNDEKLTFKDSDNPGDPFLNIADLDTYTISLDWQNDFAICDYDLLTIGMEYDRFYGENEGSFEETMREIGIYANNQWEITGNLSNITGIRFDYNENFKNKWTASTSVNLVIPKYSLNLYGSIASGFKAPTLNDLYFPGYGDQNLDPEMSTGFEIGIKKSLFEDKLEFILTGFYIDFDDLIGIEITTDPIYPFGVKAGNIDSAESKGIEFLTRYLLLDNLALSFSYTFDKTENDTTGEELLRRPENKFMFLADWNPLSKLFISARVLYVGERLDIGDTQLKDYVRVDLSAKYNLNENIQIYVRGENVFDEDYEEAIGYKAPGAAVYGGVKIEL